jgi:hypothetical protein
MKACTDICTQVELFTCQLGINSLHIDLSIPYLQIVTNSHGSQLFSRYYSNAGSGLHIYCELSVTRLTCIINTLKQHPPWASFISYNRTLGKDCGLKVWCYFVMCFLVQYSPRLFLSSCTGSVLQ